MRKGLTKTLLAVAVVTMAIQAMAMAPVIGEIPSPVIGDLVGTSDSNTFVWPDAIDLTQYVSDQESTPGQILWSYEIITANPSDPHLYQINGAAEVVAGVDNLVTPPAGKIIAGPGATDDDPAKVDSHPYTITIRNKHLSPIEGPNAADSGTTGVLSSETQAVTFYASDGTTVSLQQPSLDRFKVVRFYTTDNEEDRFSGGMITVDPRRDFTTGSQGFAFGNQQGGLTSAQSASGLCMTTPALGDNSGEWHGPHGMLALVANSAYRIRAVLNGTMQSGQCPYYDIIVNSYGLNAGGTLTGLNLYGGNMFFLDSAGTANAAVAAADKTIDVWYCPSAVSTANWNDASDQAGLPAGTHDGGPFNEANLDKNGAFIQFRILDASSSDAAIHASTSLGTLCLKSLQIDRCDLGILAVTGSNLYPSGATAVTDSAVSGGNTRVEPGGANYTANWDGDGLRLNASGTVQSMFLNVNPEANGHPVFDYQNQASVEAYYPVRPDHQALYQVSMDLAAPTATDAANPPDIFWLGADTVTNDLIQLSYVTLNSWHHAMPTTTRSTYKMLFWSGYGVATTNPVWFDNFRPRFMLANSSNLGGGGEANTGALKIYNMRVDKLATP